MKKLIKLCSVIMLFALILSILPSCGKEETFVIPPQRELSEDAEEIQSGSYIYLIFTDNTAVITEYTGSESTVKIPEKLDGHKVVALGSGSFYYNETVTNVTIPSSVETIYASAFEGCSKLEKITIPNTVWEIYPGAFTDTPWLNKQKGDFVIVGDSVLIKYNGTSSTVVIPDTVKHIGGAFSGNENIKDVTIPDSVFTIGYGAFASSTVSRVDLGKRVVWIGNSAFNYCENLYYIDMPDSVKRIDEYAFGNCSGLSYVKIGKGVEYIASYAFYRSAQFDYIYLPKSLVQKDEKGNPKKTIGDHAFYDCESLLHVFFEGSADEFKALGLTGSNQYLTDAEKTYNYEY